jgi:hypothetical protein
MRDVCILKLIVKPSDEIKSFHNFSPSIGYGVASDE